VLMQRKWKNVHGSKSVIKVRKPLKNQQNVYNFSKSWEISNIPWE